MYYQEYPSIFMNTITSFLQRLERKKTLGIKHTKENKKEKYGGSLWIITSDVEFI